MELWRRVDGVTTWRYRGGLQLQKHAAGVVRSRHGTLETGCRRVAGVAKFPHCQDVVLVRVPPLTLAGRPQDTASKR